MPLAPAALEPLLRLALTPGIGPQRLSRLLRHFGSAERVLGAPAAEWARLPGLGPELLRRLREAAGPAGARRAHGAVQALQRAGAVALTPDDLEFPAAFRTLAEPPFLLFAAGDLRLLDRPGVALVGTRAPTAYGEAVAARLGGELAAAGFVAVSGMARGIDSAAHAAALEAGGGSIGVLGHGIDRVYPPENRRLFERMRTEGLLLTEFLPGEKPKAGNFPRRNRLIAALSEGVVVVEMGLRSGAQHTVTFALEQGREVFAVPGPITSAASEGSNQLIRDGARLVASAADVVEELRGVGRPDAARPTPAARDDVEARPEQPALPLSPPVSADEARVLERLGAGTEHVDALCASLQAPPSTLLAMLLALELRGLVAALPGKRFQRVRQ